MTTGLYQISLGPRFYRGVRSLRAPPTLTLLPPKVPLDQESTILFVHIPKAGGTTFNQRLTSLSVSPLWVPCEKHTDLPVPSHNGHLLVEPFSCDCFRSPANAAQKARWRKDTKEQRWLISPVTTGWELLGGVHAPVRYVHNRCKSAYHITMLREPLSRAISEFYEVFDGWGRCYETPPGVDHFCSSDLPPQLKAAATAGNAAPSVDTLGQVMYDKLLPHWLRCSNNMASNRQTRILSLARDSTQEAHLRQRHCNVSPGCRLAGLGSENCSLAIARWTLMQFTYFGLSEERCLSERLFTAQFGLEFSDDLGLHVTAKAGKGAHKLKNLAYDELKLDDQQQLVDNNRLDIELYKTAHAVFFKRIAQYNISRRGCTL